MSSGPATFIFASESGNITGWNANVPPPPFSTQAQPAAHTPDAVYKGLAIASAGGNTYLYATDFHHNRIDVFDSSFTPATLSGNFTDPNLPAHFAPFGIQAFGNTLLVTYAMQDADAHDDVAGAGNGFVDVFSSNGDFVRRLISRVAGVVRDHTRPEPLALLGRGYARMHRPMLAAHLYDGVRVCLEVVEPGRVLRIAALGGDEHEVVAVALGVGERADALLAALGADMGEQQGGRRAWHLVADQPAARAIDQRVARHDPSQHGPGTVAEVAQLFA